MPARTITTLCFALLVSAALVVCANGQSAALTAAGRYFGHGTPSPSNLPQRRAKPAPQPMDVYNGSKPFQQLYREPTLSPYLSLELVNDDGTALPNYYAFYKPQRDQRQALESQEARIRRLQQQVRVAGSTEAISRNPVVGMPTTGNSSQFMNLGGYFPGLR